MAYDKNDPETKAALKAAVEAALAEQADDHEADVAGLKKKNRELIADLKEARKGNGGADNTADIERIEGELTAAKKALRVAEKAATDAAAERDEAVATATKETAISRKLLVENSLTAELAKVKVKEELLPGALAMLSGKVELKEVGGERKAFVNGKPLGEFVTEWSQGDEGKHYTSAEQNGGGAGHKTPTNPQGGNKTIGEMSLEERTALQKEDPAKFNELVQAAKAEAKKKRPGNGF